MTPNSQRESAAEPLVSEIVPDKLGSNRLDSIDVLRGAAAFAVGLFHLWGHDGTYPWPSAGVVHQSASPHLLSYFTSPMRWGFLGVSLFLVLSGFCIHLPNARRKDRTGGYQFNPKEFYLRRMWRLYPAYFVAIMFAVTMMVVGRNVFHVALEVPTLTDVWLHLTMLHGVVEDAFYTIVSVFWSLALEFQLYLAYPLFLILFRKMGTAKGVILLTLVALAIRWYLLDQLGFGLVSISDRPHSAALGSVLTRMPEWLFGVWLAEYYVEHKTALASGKLRILFASFAGFFFLGILSSLDPDLWFLTDPLFGVGFALLIASSVLGRAKVKEEEGRLYRGFAWLGVISYSFYLFHLPLSWIGNVIAQHQPGILLPFVIRVVFLFLSIPVIALLFRFVERPFLAAPKVDGKLFASYQRIRGAIGLSKAV